MNMQINELNLERDLAFDRSKVVDGNIFDPAFKRRPAETFMEWATKTPFYMLFGGWPQAVATRHEDVKRAFGDHEYFSSVKRPWRGIEKFYYFQGLPVVTEPSAVAASDGACVFAAPLGGHRNGFGGVCGRAPGCA
jgi:hypothetical protein